MTSPKDNKESPTWHAAFLTEYRLTGNWTGAARKVGITPTTARNHCTYHPDFARKVEIVRAALRANEEQRRINVKDQTAAQKRDHRFTLPDCLTNALDRAIHAPEFIEAQQFAILPLIEMAKDDTERDAYQWLYDYVENHTRRAAECAIKRYHYLRQIVTEADVKYEMELCADGLNGTLHWFEMYAWGIDPRSRGILKTVPFLLFDIQKRFITWIEETTFVRRTSGIAEKSRDMGATESFLRWCNKQWLFMPQFSALLITEKEDKVDNQKDNNSLFGKLRFQMEHLPRWMLPAGFDVTRPDVSMPHMNIVNPVNKSQLTGAAPTPNVGRAPRVTVVLKDEFAFWPHGGYPQDTSFSETSPSLFSISTVGGKTNRFYEEASALDANLFVMDWKEHPFKDVRWYNSLPYGYLQKKMRADEIAQEIDRNYEASQPGRVWPHFSEIHTVITMSEFRAYFERKGVRVPGEGGEYPRVPLGWTTARLNDRGATPGHRNAWLWAAGPRETDPLSDSIVCYREWLVPLGATYTEIAESVFEFEEEDGEGANGRMLLSLNSHEAESERNNYELEHDLFLEPWETNYEVGIAQVGEFLTVIDKKKPNPFRPKIMGRTRLIILVADGQGELVTRENGEKGVVKGRDFLGMTNLRRQIGIYHYPPEERGKPVGKMRPRKIDDDVVDCLKALGVHWGGLHAPESAEERMRARLKKANARLNADDIMRIANPEERRAALDTYDVHYQRLHSELKPRRTGSAFASIAMEAQRKRDREDAGIWAQNRRRDRLVRSRRR